MFLGTLLEGETIPQKETPHLTQIHYAEPVPDAGGKILDGPLDQPFEGTIVSLSAQHIAIRRKDERAGEVVVHFPRAGFLVVPAA